jgi:hypothetical protein
MDEDEDGYEEEDKDEDKDKDKDEYTDEDKDEDEDEDKDKGQDEDKDKDKDKDKVNTIMTPFLATCREGSSWDEEAIQQTGKQISLASHLVSQQLNSPYLHSSRLTYISVS